MSGCVRWVVCAALGALMWGCASAPSASVGDVRSAPAWPELHRGPLTDYVPSAGLRWLLTGSPRYFAQHPALGPLRESWLTDDRFRAFAAATGIDLTRTERALVAGFDLGTLYMADASGWVDVPEAPFAERLAGSGRMHRPHPQVWRLTGVVGSMPQALVRVDRDLMAVSVGDLMPARIVELRARGRLPSVATALRGAALSDLPPELTTPGPLRFYAPGPFEGEWLGEGRGLLGAARAVAASLELSGQSAELCIALTGYWDTASDRERLQEAWQVVAASSVGQLLGLDHPSEPIEVDAELARLVLRARVDAPSLLAGIQQLFAHDVGELLRSNHSEAGALMSH
jgi:hypothetical protein